ncbi:MAG: cell division topological specificity factor MinE [Candidatus Sericytochromatia bacterium]|nr:cell division topological specificity factor MinE [Candidatus Sericytochromatia bacterium]
MGLSSFFGRLLGRPEAVSSRTAATDRLKLVLMHDRTDIPATMMEAIRTEMVAVLSKYVEIDTEALDVQLEREQGAIGLVLNIPIKRVKTELEASEAFETMHALQREQDGEAGGDEQAAEAAVAPADAADEAATPEAPAEIPDAEVGEAAEVQPEPAAAEAEAEVDEAVVAEAGEPAAAGVGRSGASAIEVAQPAKTVTLPVRRFSTLKSPDVGALLHKMDDEGDERPKLVRDAWYSAEALLAQTPSERTEPSD